MGTAQLSPCQMGYMKQGIGHTRTNGLQRSQAALQCLKEKLHQLQQIGRLLVPVKLCCAAVQMQLLLLHQANSSKAKAAEKLGVSL